ncbi:hypothetical protein [Williamsia sterculiae]|uniref:Uncharacterized protein n=1 Tax=Williamsia sterculiae TaxID=1344003 RepID=A0A1N7HEG8_9NOCA|nr:hypothetical protein [Williamsia sterculiae]SIS23098.1 hypothetical protein SAMN05445060_4052 [Williamsia sterculiae]
MNDTPPPSKTASRNRDAVPSDETRRHHRADLIRRAKLVRTHGWPPFRHSWSDRELAGVALVLDDNTIITEVAGTQSTALDTWATNLWGINAGNEDSSIGHPRTHGWFAAIRTAT